MNKYTIFISDIHLNEFQPEMTQRFVQFLAKNQENIEKLYILGDLFDYWIGDDDATPLSQQISQTLKKCADTGMKIYFIYGNRDYLIGKNFAHVCGMTLLKQKTVIDLYGTRTLLMHGDLLCTEDRHYQWYRKVMFSTLMKKIVLLLPLYLRRLLAKKLRHVSQESNRIKSIKLMDVSEASVIGDFLSYKADLLIHGHTHQPKTEIYTLTEKKKTRMVLGAWSVTQGNVIIATASKQQHINFDDAALLEI